MRNLVFKLTETWICFSARIRSVNTVIVSIHYRKKREIKKKKKNDQEGESSAPSSGSVWKLSVSNLSNVADWSIDWSVTFLTFANQLIESNLKLPQHQNRAILYHILCVLNFQMLECFHGYREMNFISMHTSTVSRLIQRWWKINHPMNRTNADFLASVPSVVWSGEANE